MTKFYVDSATLFARADELDALAEQLMAEINRLCGHEEALAGMWDGPAKNAFRGAFNRDVVQMRNFYNAIRVYAAQLREIASVYERMEQINRELASNRTYCGC